MKALPHPWENLIHLVSKAANCWYPGHGLLLDPKSRAQRSSHAPTPLSWFRLDTTLIDFTDMKCQRGDLSFIFNGDAAPSQSFVVLDNEAKVYQRIHHEVSEWVYMFPMVPLGIWLE